MQIQLSDHFDYKKLIRFVLPSVVMMVFTSIYGVVDGLFISNFVGSDAFTAVNIVYPFAMILGGVGFMVGTGGTALVAKTLGEGRRELANRYFTMMVYFTIILGVSLSAIGIAFIRPVSYLLGADDELIDYCVLYGSILIGFTVAFMLQNLFQNFLVAAEKSKFGFVVTVAAGCTNMLLDALFVGAFRWGVVGAAVASGLSQLVGGVLPLIYFIRKNDSLLRLVPVKLELAPIIKAVTNGASELMSNISTSVVSMVYNLQLLLYFGKNGVSAYGVIMYVQFVFIAIFIGYIIGAAPIVGYNFGAKNRSELQNILKKSVILMSAFGVAMTVLAFILASPLAKLFVGYDAELCDLTTRALRLFAPTFLLAGLNIFASGFFTALNNGLVSAIISFLRTLVFQLFAVLLFPSLIGGDAIWWSVAFSELAAFIISLIFLVANNKKYGYFDKKSLHFNIRAAKK
jgi:putative MATE family efflux protein